uniref:Cadherin domain-containing protein n=1 Tax=Knipowitschia caucasica TaxID=637954 RepID=A0AAV2JPW4_KNICA
MEQQLVGSLGTRSTNPNTGPTQRIRDRNGQPHHPAKLRRAAIFIRDIPSKRGKTENNIEGWAVNLIPASRGTKSSWNFTVLSGETACVLNRCLEPTAVQWPNSPDSTKSRHKLKSCEFTFSLEDGLETFVKVDIMVQDINDNKPELVTDDIFVCENDRANSVLGTLRATDKDEQPPPSASVWQVPAPTSLSGTTAINAEETAPCLSEISRGPGEGGRGGGGGGGGGGGEVVVREGGRWKSSRGDCGGWITESDVHSIYDAQVPGSED